MRCGQITCCWTKSIRVSFHHNPDWWSSLLWRGRLCGLWLEFFAYYLVNRQRTYTLGRSSCKIPVESPRLSNRGHRFHPRARGPFESAGVKKTTSAVKRRPLNSNTEASTRLMVPKTVLVADKFSTKGNKQTHLQYNLQPRQVISGGISYWNVY